MTTNLSFNEWISRLHEVCERATDEQAQEFVRLVDLAGEEMDLARARALLKTFSEEPDYGTQEAVISALGRNSRVFIKALLEALSELRAKAPRWVEDLVGREVQFRPEILIEAARSATPQQVKALSAVLSNQSFLEFYEPAAKVLAELSAITDHR